MRPALLVAGVALTVCVGFRLDTHSALAITVLASGAALGGVGLQLHRALDADRGQPRFDNWREWLIVSLPMLMLGVVQELMNQLDIILLGRLADERQAAIFAASWRLASFVPFALVGLASLGGPLIASAYESGSLNDLHRISRIISRAGFAFALVISLVLVSAGDWLLRLYGDEFTSGRNVLLILIVGGLVNSFTGIVAYLMTLTGRERQALAIFSIALVLSAALNIALIPRFGAVGAATASSAGLAAWNLAMLAYVRAKLGIDASVLALAPRRTFPSRRTFSN